MAELLLPEFSLLNFDPFTDGLRVLLLTDAGGLDTTLNKEGGQPTDKRVRILVAQIREVMGARLSRKGAAPDSWLF
eukprot:8340725-Lingulodinium_polyedra.AAC.1